MLKRPLQCSCQTQLNVQIRIFKRDHCSVHIKRNFRPWNEFNLYTHTLISFYTCVPKITKNHVMYGSWDTEWDRIFFHFGSFFALLPLNNMENQNFENKKKKCLEMSSFYIWVPKITIIWCVLPEIWNVTDKIIGQFGPLIINYSFIIKMATKMKHGMWWLLDYLVNFYFIYFFSSAMTYTSVL